jgi:hypothetical protein
MIALLSRRYMRIDSIEDHNLSRLHETAYIPWGEETSLNYLDSADPRIDFTLTVPPPCNPSWQYNFRRLLPLAVEMNKVHTANPIVY